MTHKPVILQHTPKELLDMIIATAIDLRDTLQDNVDNMEEKFSHTERFQTYSDALDSICNAVNTLEELDIEEIASITNKIDFKPLKVSANKRQLLEWINEYLPQVRDVVQDTNDEMDDVNLQEFIDSITSAIDDLESVDLG